MWKVVDVVVKVLESRLGGIRGIVCTCRGVGASHC